MPIHADTEMGAVVMMFDDGFQNGPQGQQSLAVAGHPVIPVQRVKIPERRIHRMVERLPLSLREQIGQESILHIVGEGAKNRPRFSVSAGTERESV